MPKKKTKKKKKSLKKGDCGCGMSRCEVDNPKKTETSGYDSSMTHDVGFSSVIGTVTFNKRFWE